jgi:hypothetical protein
MKVTFNLSFLLCISSLVMPVVDARKRSAVTKRYDFAAHQQRRSLQTDGSALKALCEAFILILAPDSGCTCTEDGEPTDECVEILSGCKACDTIQGERTCIAADEAATIATSATSADGAFVTCSAYDAAFFDGMVICDIVNEAEETCTITIDGEECSSCTVIFCDDDPESASFDLDCSNIIEGETWNLCTSEISETSPFLALGNNDRFIELECASEGSGGFALSFHALSVVVGLIAVAATLW